MNQRQILAVYRNTHRKMRLDDRRATMTDAEIEARMRKIIREKLIFNESIALDDFARDNLPMERVTPLVRRMIKSVQNSMALERQ